MIIIVMILIHYDNDYIDDINVNSDKDGNDNEYDDSDDNKQINK